MASRRREAMLSYSHTVMVLRRPLVGGVPTCWLPQASLAGSTRRWAQMNLPDGAHRPFQLFLTDDAWRMQQLLKWALALSITLGIHVGTFLVPAQGSRERGPRYRTLQRGGVGEIPSAAQDDRRSRATCVSVASWFKGDGLGTRRGVSGPRLPPARQVRTNSNYSHPQSGKVDARGSTHGCATRPELCMTTLALQS